MGLEFCWLIEEKKKKRLFKLINTTNTRQDEIGERLSEFLSTRFLKVICHFSIRNFITLK